MHILMATSARLLVLYKQILAASQQMLALAQAADWDALVDQELARREIVGELRGLLEGFPNPLSETERAHTETQIREILTVDAETRSLAERWMNELGTRLQSINTSRRLQNVYLTQKSHF